MPASRRSHLPRPRRRATSRPRGRRATAYLLVLAAAAVATAAGVGGIYVQRTRLRTARSVAEVDTARVLAASGLELVMSRIKATPTWRTTIGSGSWLDGAQVGRGTLSVSVVDPNDANIANADTDSIRITSTATVGNAVQILSADIQFQKAPLTVLQCAAYGGTNVYIGTTSVTADAPIASGASMTALAATVQAPCEAVGSVNGLIYYRGTTPGAAARTVPNSATLLSTWSSRGTTVSGGLISGGVLKKPLFPGAGSATPTFDPAVHVLDCSGGALTIRDTRIYGTLVVLNASTVTVTGSVRIDPATPGYPSLIVQGQLQLALSSTALSEVTNSTNFNPTGAPWLGVTDSDKTDTYASGISGIVLATGEVQVNQALSMTGTLISLSNQLTVSSTLTITRDPASESSPPPGFYTLKPVLSSTGVRRVVN